MYLSEKMAEYSPCNPKEQSSFPLTGEGAPKDQSSFGLKPWSFPQRLQEIPYDQRTLNICATCCAENGLNLKHVPLEYINTDRDDFIKICITAIINCPNAFKYVPRELHTFAMCMYAVQRKGSVLGYVHYSPTLMSAAEYEKVCLTAFENKGTGHMLSFIPVHMQTPAIQKAALSSTAGWVALQYIPVPQRTEEFCVLAYTQDVKSIEHIPAPYVDYCRAKRAFYMRLSDIE